MRSSARWIGLAILFAGWSGRPQTAVVTNVGIRRTRGDADHASADARPGGVEIWYAPELHEMVAMRTSELQSELREIQRGAPDAALFYPPAGYRIEKGF